MRKIIVFCLMFMASCTVGPDFERRDVYQDRQIAESLQLTGKDLKIDPCWYQDFKDESLNVLIKKSLSNNSSVLSAIERLKQARTSVKIARAEYLPKLNTSAGYDYMKPSDNIGLAADTNYFSLGFDANWEIDIWGAGRRLNEKTTAQFWQNYYSLQNIKALIVAETANTYFALKTAQEKWRISKENLALQQDIFKTVEAKYQAGLADIASFHQSKYVLNKTKALIPALEAQIKAYQTALAVLAGVLPDQLNVDLSINKNNPIKKAYQYDMKKLFDLPSNIIRTRADVKAAEKAMVAQNASIGQAIAAVYPNISISGLLGLQSSAGSKLFKSSSKAYGYEPSLVQPIFHFGQLKNQIELEREKMEETYRNYRQILLGAVKELADSLTNLQKEYQTNRASQNAAHSMRQAFQSMKEKYESGLIEYAALLEVQQDLLEAETDLAQSNGAIYQKIIAFYKATGGGYNDEK